MAGQASLTVDSNSRVHRELAHMVAQRISDARLDDLGLDIGPLSPNYFSFTFPLEVDAHGSRSSVYVKVPKADVRGGAAMILPITDEDRRLAEDEARSLDILAKEWRSEDLGVSWVRLRTVVPEYNAIVTDRADAAPALDVFRTLDLRRRLGLRGHAQRLRGAMARWGEALGRFHQLHARKTIFRAAVDVPKLEFYAREIVASRYGPGSLEVAEAFRAIAGLELEAVEVQTLKGIDIRNIMINGQDELFLLDPGRMKSACREADLARFVMTYRILYWGSPLFLLGLRPDPTAEAMFFEAYFAACPPPSPQLLSCFLVKEILKHWHTAVYSLDLLRWPSGFKRLVAATYITPYYGRRLARELKTVTR